MLLKGIGQFANLSCRWHYERLLSAYLDKELNAHEEEDIAGHLRECDRCRVEFEQLRFAHRALIEFEIPPMRSPLTGGQVFQLQRSKEVSPLRRLYTHKIAVPLPLAAGLAITLISATLFAFVRNQRTPIPPAASVTAPSSTVIKTVEVPVDRVVIRTVYSRQAKGVRGSRKENRSTFTPSESKREIAQNAGRASEWSDSTLKDFRPAASANLRVVQGHEK